jgi:uncharacterized membrane protein YfcA
LSITNLCLLMLVCFVGGIIQSSCGFGFGLFSVNFFPFLLPVFHQTPALLSLTTIILSASILLSAWPHIQYRLSLTTVAGFIIPSAAMIWFSVQSADSLLRQLLGGTLILLSVYLFIFSDKIRIRPTLLNGIIFGAMAGTLGGLFGIGGPPIIIFMLSAVGDNKEQYRASINLYFLLSNIWASSMRAVNGIITLELLGWAGMCAVGIFAGTAIGNRIFKMLNALAIRRIVYTLMMMSGAVMLFKLG